jgi:hypothetical protein
MHCLDDGTGAPCRDAGLGVQAGSKGRQDRICSLDGGLKGGEVRSRQVGGHDTCLSSARYFRQLLRISYYGGDIVACGHCLPEDLSTDTSGGCKNGDLHLSISLVA